MPIKKVTEQDGQSADIIADNIEQMKSLFPDAFTEGGVNFDVLRQILGDASVLDEGEEKYGLTWHGKKQARQIALTPSTGTLLPCPEESVDWDTTQNLFIESDNLEALKLLQKSYAGKVKLIYIDPPYNTGKDFVYPDNYADNLDTYLKYTGQIDETGMKFSSNTETGGRKHTNWLNMMLPRLRVAKNLLSRDGVIFISIDQNEQPQLQSLCDEIFGAENLVACLTVINNMKGRNDKKNVATAHEYLVAYARPDFESFGVPLTEEQLKDYKFTDESGEAYALRDLRKRGRPDRREDRPNMATSNNGEFGLK
jgi:adenine-specific DNA-methyltransferase